MQILDDVAEERNHDAIARCARVCRFFQHRCRKHLEYKLTFQSEEDVARLKTEAAAKEIGGWRGPKRVNVRGEKESKAIPHVTMFASRFAGRWESETLSIEKALWPSSLRVANATVFLDLSRFASITELQLDDVTFPSIVTFGALVSALPRLKELYLRDVKLTGSSFLFDPRTLSDFRLLPQPKNLERVHLGAPIDRWPEFTPTAWPCYTELLEFMSAISNPYGKSPRVYSWGSVRQLELAESIWWRFSSPSFARLLRMLPSLAFLAFVGASGLAPKFYFTCVPAYIRLKPICIIIEYLTPQHVANLVRSLIRMDYPHEITDICTPIYPFSRETDTVGTAMNELVEHAGPSLEHLTFYYNFLGVDQPKHDPDLTSVSDQYRHSDLSENTNFESI